MKKTISILLLLLIASALCPASYAQEGSKTDRSMKTESSKRVLVAFFSHTGENYAVGNIEKGNTHIIAEMIAEASGGTLFEIVPQNAYPKTYNACVEAAKKEKQAKARPAIKADAPVEEYDVYTWVIPTGGAICRCRSIRLSSSTTGMARSSYRSARARAADSRTRSSVSPPPARALFSGKGLP